MNSITLTLQTSDDRTVVLEIDHKNIKVIGRTTTLINKIDAETNSIVASANRVFATTVSDAKLAGIIDQLKSIIKND